MTLIPCSLSHFCIVQKTQKPTSKPKTSISTRKPPLFQTIMQFLNIDPTVSGCGTVPQWTVVFYQFLDRELCFKLLQEWTGQQEPQSCAEARELPQFKAAHHAGVQQETTAFSGAVNNHLIQASKSHPSSPKLRDLQKLKISSKVTYTFRQGRHSHLQIHSKATAHKGARFYCFISGVPT